MDGNGRWAKRRGLPKIMGHRAGVESVKRVVRACIKFGVKYLTLYAFSNENWQRPKNEVRALFNLLENFLEKETHLFNENNVRFCVIGERDRIEPRLRKKIEKVEKDTLENNKLVLNIALSYGARQEILNAARKISEDAIIGSLKPSEINEDIFSRYLYTKDCPDPDLLIRTSGEMRVSNFLLWQISYAELYVTEKFWPDFREADLKKAIEEYSRRERRFGR
jgi:undecaprenyl diphosphate synthase